MIRRIIQIDQEKCNGCSACAEACHEGAIAMVDGKAKLMRDDYCDGLGDCLPACPMNAITFVEREAAPYNEAAVQAAKARNTDVLICDTAGRLHNKKNLMEELKKINRIIDKEYPEAYRETLLVLDGTTGQNALSQAKQFMEVADISGIILTKMDGTAKGGIAVAIQSELGIPVKYIGVGETIDDLQKFDSEQFVDALFSTREE